MIRRAALLLGPILLLAHCSGDDDAGPSPPSQDAATDAVHAIFTVPASLAELTDEHYYDHPWPSDLRRDPDHTIHVSGLFNPRKVALVDTYSEVTKGLLDGFSPVAAGYLRFTAAIDPASLPASPPASLDPHASVQLVDVDPASPEHGARKLVQTFWRAERGAYWLENTLAVMPALGYPLRPKTRYALVVTRALRAPGGGAVAPSPDLEEVIGARPATPHTQALHDAWGPALGELAAAGIPAEDVAHLTVFTTNDPAAELFAITDDVHANVAVPTADPGAWQAKERTADYDVYEGSYGPSPNYQAGNIPYANPGDGGQFVFEAGKPKVQGTFSLRFTLVIPKAETCPPPVDGYPIVLYAHGTGGDYRSIVTEKHAVGQALADRCLASMGVDQIFHGARPGAPPENSPNREAVIQLLFFNLNNPVAGRTNGRQSAVDVIQQARLFTDAHVAVPASVSYTGQEIRFDASRLLFFGHSQGGLNGTLSLAADGQARGGVLSGSASMITVALLEKTQPEPSVAGAVRAFLELTKPEDAEELNLFHPILNLAQSIVDATDPIHYAPYVVRHPRPGHRPKSVYQTEGVLPDGTGDSYAPPHGIEIGAVALGLPRMAPGIHPVVEASFGGDALRDVTVPAAGLSGNLAGGEASGVLAQFLPAPGTDGHFVVFEVPEARNQASGFCQQLAADAKGRVPAP